MSSYRVGPTIAALVLTIGCGSEKFVDGAASAAAIDGGSVDANGVKDGNVDDAASAEAGPTSCPGGMIKTPQTCIDAHEVTAGEYAAFVLQVGSADIAKLPPACAYKTNTESFRSTLSTTQPTLPMSNVDWCDAFAFCAKRGKRLCGKSEWLAACTKGGAQKVPYMPQPTNDVNPAGRCVLKESAVRSTTRPDNTCEGGYPGLFDMLGNVEEWIDTCDGGADNSACTALGSAFNDDLEFLDSTCASVFEVARNARRADVGFRCCK